MRDSDQGDRSDGPLWADGDMMFHVDGVSGEPERLVKVTGPFALVGRSPGADVLIDDPGVNGRHVYLHLDPRGVYAVDLVTRSGTRINGEGRMVGWLRPGDWLEVAGRRIELVRVRLGGSPASPLPCDDDLLADSARPGLAAVTLEPRRSNESPWVLGSELVFLGQSDSCGIPVNDPSVSRTHCALVRSTNGTYLVDLRGRKTWVEDRPVRGVSALQDGDLITLGSTQFTVRIEPPARPLSAYPALRPEASLPAVLEPRGGLPALSLSPTLSIDPALIPVDAQHALLAWMMGTIQGGQGEVLRRQGEFQVAITQVLRQIQQDNATLLNTHLSRIESIDRELATLRAELQRRDAGPTARPLPNVTPLRVAKHPQQATPPGEPKAQTTWLLQRVNQLEAENRSAWKDLLGRIGAPRGSS